ncbi:hypothetical protein [Cyclobacterium plantarum]|uniref:hypothetical protein n=1 Tax=Cyclobacterium plantarum TaxID=2716263 RepID=UPI003F7094BB
MKIYSILIFFLLFFLNGTTLFAQDQPSNIVGFWEGELGGDSYEMGIWFENESKYIRGEKKETEPLFIGYIRNKEKSCEAFLSISYLESILLRAGDEMYYVENVLEGREKSGDLLKMPNSTYAVGTNSKDWENLRAKENCSFLSDIDRFLTGSITNPNQLIVKSIHLKLGWLSGEFFRSIPSPEIAEIIKNGRPEDLPFKASKPTQEEFDVMSIGAVLPRNDSQIAKNESFGLDCAVLEICLLDGGDYLDAIYRSDKEAIGILDQKYTKFLTDWVNGMSKDYKSILNTNTSQKFSIFNLVLLEYMHHFKYYPQKCFKSGAKNLLWKANTQTVVTKDLYGNTTNKSGGIELVGDYYINEEFIEICKELGGVRTFEFKYFWENNKVLKGLREFMYQYECDSPEIRQFEKSLLELYSVL